jgi:hypothetical protein
VTEGAPEVGLTATDESKREATPPPSEKEALSALDSAIADLDRAATRLREGELDAEQAAALVEECADLAARVGAELEGAARPAASAEAPPSGQETLL